jgi:hypothetical protein
MTRLTASPAASQALYRRKVTDYGALIRGRVEAYPALARLMSKLSVAENKLKQGDCAEAERLFRELDSSVERHEQDLVDAA